MCPECEFCKKFPKRRFSIEGPNIVFDVCKDHYSLGVDLETEFADKLSKIYREFHERVISINKEKQANYKEPNEFSAGFFDGGTR